MKEIIFFYITVIFLYSCTSSSEELERKELYKGIEKSLAISNRIINQNIDKSFTDFEKKMQDPFESERATLWKAKADIAKARAEKVLGTLDTLRLIIKEDVSTSNTNYEDSIRQIAAVLFNEIAELRLFLLNLDSSVKYAFEKELQIDTFYQHNSNKNIFIERLIQKQLEALVFLSKVENDIRSSEATIIDFFSRKLGGCILTYDEYTALSVSNATTFKPGQELVITSGIGSFSKAARPQITVDNEKVELTPLGYAEYRKKLHEKGNFSKMVKIKFIKPDGTEAELVKKIEYEVTDCPK